MNVGIIGAGRIARKMAYTINNLEGFNAYGIASRSLEKAINYKNEFGFEKAYGSYEELASDPKVELIYIATPHSEHFENMKLCLKYGKPVLCEKIFTTSSKDTEEIYKLYEEKKVFVLEAMWCAFMPLRKVVKELLDSHIIGDVLRMESSFECSLMSVERVYKRSLGGGAAMDIGVYPISFALRTLGFNYDKCEVKELRHFGDVDEYEIVELSYGDIKAVCKVDGTTDGPTDVTIFGTNGHIHIDRVTAANFVRVYDKDNYLIKEIDTHCPLGGFEYELLACKAAIENNKIECEEWSHVSSIALAKIIDKIVF